MRASKHPHLIMPQDLGPLPALRQLDIRLRAGDLTGFDHMTELLALETLTLEHTESGARTARGLFGANGSGSEGSDSGMHVSASARQSPAGVCCQRRHTMSAASVRHAIGAQATRPWPWVPGQHGGDRHQQFLPSVQAPHKSHD